ncbi:MAG: TerB family tellurite resistance protein [Bacteroidota bacterium]
MAVFKWIGGAVGWALGGYLGGMIGYALGSVLDGVSDDKLLGSGTDQRKRTSSRKTYDQRRPKQDQYRYQTQKGDFTISLMALFAAVMKADGKVLKSELNYVKKYLVGQWGQEATQEYLRILKTALDSHMDIRKVSQQIKYNMRHHERLQLVHYLFRLAESDGHIDNREVEMIRQITGYLGINMRDYASIEAMFFNKKNRDYEILEIQPEVSNDEVKKAYRKMAKKYHPDKLTQLGPEVQIEAKRKFQAIQEAYDNIKLERRMK